MGNVYRATHEKLNRTVALKVLPPVLANKHTIERFNAEARSISRMQHPNIVTLYDYGEWNGRQYIAMEYIEGQNLLDILSKKNKSNKFFSYLEAVDVGTQIALGLQCMHQNQIIHRDIKSGNVLITKEGHVYLSDFGIAQTPDSTRLTTTGMTMGTPEYMSPEQCEGKAIDEQCDIYSFGIVLYEILTGNPPFLGENALSVAYKQVHDKPALLSETRSDVPPALEKLVDKCLQKDKRERYRSMEEVLEDMEHIFPSHSTPHTQSHTVTKRAGSENVGSPTIHPYWAWFLRQDPKKSVGLLAGCIAGLALFLSLFFLWFLSPSTPKNISWIPIGTLSQSGKSVSLPTSLTSSTHSSSSKRMSVSWEQPQWIQGVAVEFSEPIPPEARLQVSIESVGRKVTSSPVADASTVYSLSLFPHFSNKMDFRFKIQGTMPKTLLSRIKVTHIHVVGIEHP
jgi:serine/threonine protein kinase